jgi:hypothetical protein
MVFGIDECDSIKKIGDGARVTIKLCNDVRKWSALVILLVDKYKRLLQRAW